MDAKARRAEIHKQALLAEKRKVYASKLKDEIRACAIKIKRHELTNENMRSSASAGKDIDFIENTIARNKQSIAGLQDEIAKLKIKLDGVDSGLCDTEIEKMYQASADHVADMDEKAAKKEAQQAEREAKDRARGEAYTKKEYSEMRNERYMERVYVREYDRFLDVAESLPDHISRNLETMPNNKGYKWRGITFFGKLPAEPNGAVLVFDKRADGMYIWETTATSQSEYLKTRDGVKHTIVSQRRKLNFRRPATVFSK